MKKYLLSLFAVATLVSVANAAPTTQPAPAVQQAKAAETINLEYESVSLSGASSYCDLVATTIDGAYEFDFSLTIGKTKIEYGKTYTKANMDTWFTYIRDKRTGVYTRASDMSAVECVVTLDADGTTPIVDGTFELSDGTKYHAFRKVWEVPTVFTDVETGTFEEVALRTSSSSFQFNAANSSYSWTLVINSSVIAGDYTYADVNVGNTSFKAGGSAVKLCDVTATITQLNATDYTIEANFYSYDGNVYKVNAAHIEPKAEKVVTISTSSLVTETFYMEYFYYYHYAYAFYTAENDEYSVELPFTMYTDVLEGKYTDDGLRAVYQDMTITNKATGVVSKYYSYDFNVTQVGSDYAITGQVLCKDNILYVLDLGLTTTDVTIGATGYATVMLNGATTIPTGITVYTAEVNAAQDEVSLTEYTGAELPAMTPVIVKAEPGTYQFEKTANAVAPVSDNVLLGASVATEQDGISSYYVLANGSAGVGFYKLAAGATIPANKAYVKLDAASPARLAIDDITAIERVEVEIPGNASIYNMQGQAVKNATAGFYIINGKKAVVK